MGGENPEVEEHTPAEDLPKAEEVHSEDELADITPKDSSEEVDSVDKPEKKSFPMRETTLSLPFIKGELRFNWLVSIIGLGVLWGVSIFCMTNPNAKTELSKWYDSVILYFTWFYVLGKARCLFASLSPSRSTNTYSDNPIFQVIPS